MLLGCAPIRSGGESLRSKQQYISYKRTRSKRYINIARWVHLRQVHPLKLASVLSGICGRIFSAVGSVISVYSVGGFSQAAASVQICDICGSFSMGFQRFFTENTLKCSKNKLFSKKVAETFGGFTKKPYLCTRFKELSNTT